MAQFANPTLTLFAVALSLFFLALNFFTLRRMKIFKRRDILRIFMWSAVIIFLGAALGGMKARLKKTVPITEKMQIIYALDASLSSLAVDIVVKKNGELMKISRLDFEKSIAENSAKGLKGDAVGMIVFADQAIYLQDALAREDYKNTFLRNLKAVDKVFIRHWIKQGTDYGNLIMSALEAFDEKDGEKKVLFIFTDGEQQGEEEKLQENLKKSLKLLSERKDEVVVYFIGIGDPSQSSAIPKSEDEEGKPKEYYLYESGNLKGQPILTRPNPEFLAQLASSMGAQYFFYSETPDLENVLKNAIKKERRIIGYKKIDEMTDLAPFLLICSLVFLFTIPILKSV